MPAYFTNDQINSMISKSNESIFNLENTRINVHYYKSSINKLIKNQLEFSNNSIPYYEIQKTILIFTSQIEIIILPFGGFEYISIINNNPVLYEEEIYLLDEKIEQIKLEEKHKKDLEKSKIIYKKLILGNMTQILPEDILENISYYLVHKRPSKKKQPTNWHNFCKQRKLYNLPYNENKNIWKLLDNNIKNKYKNPYYKHF